jgi:hypothetical protein
LARASLAACGGSGAQGPAGAALDRAELGLRTDARPHPDGDGPRVGRSAEPRGGRSPTTTGCCPI